jgi:erythromycin esterase
MEFDYFQHRIAQIARPMKGADNLNSLLEWIGPKRIVMLGESSHGTKEFYQWRAAITQALIDDYGFNLVAVEADWAPCEAIDRCVKGQDELDLVGCLQHFTRWPTWMWGNAEMLDFLRWLQAHNRGRENPAGFYGLDLYSIFDSVDLVTQTLEEIDPALAQFAFESYACFRPFCKDEVSFVRSMINLPPGCRKEVVGVLKAVGDLAASRGLDPKLFSVLANARVVASAERYYRAIVNADDASWDIREEHMMDTLVDLLDFHGADSKLVVWEHNSHISDIRNSGKTFNGHLNLGSLAREKYGSDQVALVGLGTYKGMVAASNAWEGDLMELPIPIGRKGSLEDELHAAVKKVGCPDYYLLLNREPQNSPLNEERGSRSIGAVYHPGLESRSSYLPTILAQRYDAYIFLDETTPVSSLAIDCDRSKIPETYPFNDKLI